MLSGSFSIWHWAIVLVLVIAIFGTRKLRTAGDDIGAAVRNFKSSMRQGEAEEPQDVRRQQLAAPAAAGQGAREGQSDRAA